LIIGYLRVDFEIATVPLLVNTGLQFYHDIIERKFSSNPFSNWQLICSPESETENLKSFAFTELMHPLGKKIDCESFAM
jgi:hypothetical protein